MQNIVEFGLFWTNTSKVSGSNLWFKTDNTEFLKKLKKEIKKKEKKQSPISVKIVKF